jgi:hypothetical protein
VGTFTVLVCLFVLIVDIYVIRRVRKNGKL